MDVESDSRVTTDVLGEPYLAETITLDDDDEGEVIATLVHRATTRSRVGAVLHLHGFADYFYQTSYADWWAERGYDFYAIDLRKYGRSLLPHQTPAFVTDIRAYWPEIDEAWRLITERDGHSHVVMSGHSTGGLIAGLWANERQPSELGGVVLNSPWVDLQGSAALRVVGTPIIKQLGAYKPMREIKRHVTGFYGRSLHRDHDGEWDFDLIWKPIESFTIYAGWLRAIREAHAELHRGLSLSCPVLVLSSGRSSFPQEMGEDVHGTDIVLDVRQIRRWATAFGSHVTYVAIEGARHDVVLSREEPRAAAYDAIDRWLGAYLDQNQS